MGNTTKAVVFNLPNGKTVSNDPRHAEEQMRNRILANAKAEAEYAAELRREKGKKAESEGSSTSTDDDDGDGTQEVQVAEGLSEDWKGDQLKEEVARLKDLGVEVDTSGVKTKADLVEAINNAVSEHNSQ